MDMDNANTTRESRMLRYMVPDRLDRYREDEGLWYESPQEARMVEERYKRREKRLAWVRAVMLLQLTPRENQCVNMHYLESKTFRAIGKELGIHPSNANRHCRSGIHKLQKAAQSRGSRASRPRFVTGKMPVLLSN